MNAYLNGSLVKLDPSKSKGKGGEADIFQIQTGVVAKIFKTATHPDFAGMPLEQSAATSRIAEHQKKLRDFPQGLTDKVITPQNLLMDVTGNLICGYTMKFISGAEPLFRYSERTFRQGISNDKMISILKSLHLTVEQIHQHRDKVVIGDFNDLNVLVLDEIAYVIDADSFQFGNFLCKMFTTRFVDPLLCDKNASNLMLVRQYNQDSDWYSFTIMMMQSLLFVNPYGGIYLPKDVKKRIPQDGRILRRITVFNSEVRYPKPAIPYKVLPDDLLNHLYKVFEKDERGVFPYKLLEEINWSKCPSCGLEHARRSCPDCAIAPEIAIKEIVTIRGNVIATRIFKTDGVILFAVVQNNVPKWIYHEDDKFKRENKEVFLNGKLDPYVRYRISGENTLLGKGTNLIVIDKKSKMDTIVVDAVGNLPIFDANELRKYWLENGKLLCDGKIASEFIGNVLAGQTLFWIGQTFGFGFYRAGGLSVFFVFDLERKGINDDVRLPTIKGLLVDSTCVFTSELCWFFVSTQYQSNILNQCFVIKRNGEVIAHAEGLSSDNTWLSTIRGKCAVSNLLFSASDAGLIRFEAQSGQIVQTGEFPDTEPFINSNSHILIGKEGIYVIGVHDITNIKIN